MKKIFIPKEINIVSWLSGIHPLPLPFAKIEEMESKKN
jgi:hypothetical protein